MGTLASIRNPFTLAAFGMIHKNHEKNMTYQYAMTLNSPLGLILVQGSKSHIQYLKFSDALEQSVTLDQALSLALATSLNDEADWTNECRDQLQRYFSGNLPQFNLPIEPLGTEFQKQVWQALANVKLGSISSYQHLAVTIGNVKAVRAVASANARNPIWLLIPCHRIVGSDHALRGYAGGIERKAKLLQLEGHALNCDVLDSTLSESTGSVEINEKTKVIK